MLIYNIYNIIIYISKTCYCSQSCQPTFTTQIVIEYILQTNTQLNIVCPANKHTHVPPHQCGSKWETLSGKNSAFIQGQKSRRYSTFKHTISICTILEISTIRFTKLITILSHDWMILKWTITLQMSRIYECYHKISKLVNIHNTLLDGLNLGMSGLIL